ncbi:MAG: hypothetical protein OXG82_01650 [Gammaproteobacteria bacterium]|nr:hypothetical protein [Gammaproteobacteria bacterium]
MARLARTIILGTIAAGAGIWWLGRAYDVESSALLGFLVSSAMLVAATIVAAIAGGATLFWLRRRRYRRTSFDVFRARVKGTPNRSDPADPSDP